MAIRESAYKSSVSLKLNAGSNPSTGNVITRSCSLGSVASAADAGKIMSVAALMAPVLDYPLLRVERSEVTVIENV